MKFSLAVVVFLLGYEDWKNFAKVVDKAKEACAISTATVLCAFAAKVIKLYLVAKQRSR